jgi:hypothetical protein
MHLGVFRALGAWDEPPVVLAAGQPRLVCAMLVLASLGSTMCLPRSPWLWIRLKILRALVPSSGRGRAFRIDAKNARTKSNGLQQRVSPRIPTAKLSLSSTVSPSRLVSMSRMVCTRYMVYCSCSESIFSLRRPGESLHTKRP